MPEVIVNRTFTIHLCSDNEYYMFNKILDNYINQKYNDGISGFARALKDALESD